MSAPTWKSEGVVIAGEGAAEPVATAEEMSVTTQREQAAAEAMLRNAIHESVGPALAP